MKIVCPKSSLLNGISIVSKAVPTRTTMPILECILIDATTSEIKLVTNDMELGIETIIEGDIQEKGMVAINARQFGDIVRKFTDDQVFISTRMEGEDLKTYLVCGNSKFDLSSQSGEDFIGLPYIEKDSKLTLSEKTLKEMIQQTIFSIAINDNNKLMTGELFESKSDTFKITSLDGHRISIRKSGLRAGADEFKVIVPGKTLQEVSKILSGEQDKEANLYVTDNHIIFVFGKTTVVSRLIEGEYFKVEQMLSNDYETKIVINRRAMLDCIDRGTVLISEGDKKPIILTIEDGNVNFKIKSAVGMMDESIEVEKTGKDLMIGFNPKFLIDALKSIDDEDITIFLMSPKAPCFIKDKEENYVYLILPVNFNAANV